MIYWKDTEEMQKVIVHAQKLAKDAYECVNNYDDTCALNAIIHGSKQAYINKMLNDIDRLKKDDADKAKVQEIKDLIVKSVWSKDIYTLIVDLVTIDNKFEGELIKEMCELFEEFLSENKYKEAVDRLDQRMEDNLNMVYRDQ